MIPRPTSSSFLKTYLFIIKPEKMWKLLIVLYPFIRFIWLSFSVGVVFVWKILLSSSVWKWKCEKCFISSCMLGWVHGTVLAASLRKKQAKDSDAICLTTLFKFVLECFMFWILLCCSKAVDGRENLLSCTLVRTLLQRGSRREKKICYMLLHLTGFKFFPLGFVEHYPRIVSLR